MAVPVAVQCDPTLGWSYELGSWCRWWPGHSGARDTSLTTQRQHQHQPEVTMSSKGWVMRKREQFELFARTVEARPGLAPAQPSYKPAEAAHGEAEVGDKYMRR